MQVTLRRAADVAAVLWFMGISYYYYDKLEFLALARQLLGVGQ